MRSALLITLGFVLSLATPVTAQDAVTSLRQSQLDTEAAEAEALREREAAESRVYEDMVTMSNLVEALAKNLGQLHFLRTLCFGSDDQKWREIAQDMMDLEAGGNDDEKREFVRAFNAGFYQEKARYEQCSQAVSVDAAALAENGRHIASMLGDPYREF